MPKAFLIKKKHDAKLASALSGVKRPWTEDLVEELRAPLSVSPVPSVSPSLSENNATVPGKSFYDKAISAMPQTGDESVFKEQIIYGNDDDDGQSPVSD